MDFSSPSRSLTSLSRRKPSLPSDVVALSQTLLGQLEQKQGGDNALDAGYGDAVLSMIGHGSAPAATGAGGEGEGGGTGVDKENEGGKEGKEEKLRWEPLAVGLNLANDYLERLCASQLAAASASAAAAGAAAATAAANGVYVEGPRMPTLTPEEEEEEASAASAAAAAGAAKEGRTSVDLATTVAFCSTLLQYCESNLEHDEPRVRTLVAKTVGSHARYGLSLVASQADAGDKTGDANARADAIAQLTSQRRQLYSRIVTSLFAQLSLGRDTSGNKSKSTEGALDDTTGWRAVETNLHALASYVNGCGGTFIDEEGESLKEYGEGSLLGAVRYCCIDHVNRHVRAAGVAVLEQLVGAVVKASASAATAASTPASNGSKSCGHMNMLTDPSSALRTVLIDVLRVTLADNWSQVRMAGSVLNRVFLVALLDHARDDAAGIDKEAAKNEAVTSLYPTLLPRMCLNRFYLAQGVKLYSHETWRLVFAGPDAGGTGGTGMEAVANNAAAVCRYYVKMCDADNHAVREAACQAVAELAQKLGSHPAYADSLAPYVPMLLQALLMCFHDESWPVRDEACLACGTFCRAYPEECRADLPTLFTRWTEQLTDQIWSVREDAAVALGDAIVAYGTEMYDKVLEVVSTNAPAAKDQPAMSREEYKRRQNDIDAHTDSQLYSCGSLAPKLRKGGAGRIGCSSCAINREKAPWEATDGCIYLLRELCVKCCEPSGEAVQVRGVVLSDETLLPLLTELADVCRVRHFPQADDLRCTLWRQLPVMAKALGKQRFKRHYLHLFLDLLIANLDADRSGSGASQLSVHAAGQCAEELANLVGMSIFRGRLEEDWQREAFDRALEERRASGSGPAGRGGPGGAPEGFSPFGPPGLIPSAVGGGAGSAAGGTFPSPMGAAFPKPGAPSKPTVPGSGFEDTL